MERRIEAIETGVVSIHHPSNTWELEIHDLDGLVSVKKITCNYETITQMMYNMVLHDDNMSYINVGRVNGKPVSKDGIWMQGVHKCQWYTVNFDDYAYMPVMHRDYCGMFDSYWDAVNFVLEKYPRAVVTDVYCR